MLSRALAVLIFVFISLGALFFFYTNESYELAFKARFYYSISNYEQSYELARRAYELDWKNKMASSLLLRAGAALKYEAYLKQGNDYSSKILSLGVDGVDKAEEKRIALMCDIMIEQFGDLGSRVHTPDELYEAAEAMRDKFKKLKSALF
ncbi:hypothetical protein LBC_11670 [Campylobacter sp. 19-13652]|nr:hypothetical protein LBC_11670 [Campylobacter sp. 19-13652]